MAGIDGLECPYSTDEFRAFVEKVRSHHWATAGQMREIATELRRELRLHLSDQGRGRADARLIAVRVTRPLIVASRLDYDVAKSALDSFNKYQHLVLGKQPATARGRRFTP